MSCKPPHERITARWVGSATATIANPNGTACIALGSNDTSGGVIITPRRSQDSYSGLKPIVVTPGKPYIGWLEGTLDVTPIATIASVAGAAFPELEVLDLISYEQIPNFRPERAAYNWEGIPAVAAIYIPVRGRKRISVVLRATASVVLASVAYRSIGGTLCAVDQKTVTGALMWWQPNANLANDQVNNPPIYGSLQLTGTDVIDYISLECGGAWLASGVEAYDE